VSRARRSEPPQGPALLTVAREQFGGEIDGRIERGHEIAERPIESTEMLDAARSDFYTWDEYNRELLKRRFTNDEVHDSYAYGGGAVFAGGPPSFAEEIEELRDDVRKEIRKLQSIKERIPLFEEAPSVRRGTPGAAQTPGAPASPQSIFIVHGRDEAAKLAVQGFIREVGEVDPVILHNEPNRGQTVIEKLEVVGSGAGYAVILLTGDDVAQLAGDDAQAERRARQNVVFEFGFFVGALGRPRVAVLYEAGVTLPSDLEGLVYIAYDDHGAWKMQLARELKDAGFVVDMNKAL
jgi:predicted nucleotide-binding protein